MIKMYEASGLGTSGEINKVDIERVNEVSVWRGGGRQARISRWRSYFDTFDEAKQHIVDNATKRADRSNQKAEYDMKCLREALELTE